LVLFSNIFVNPWP